MGDPLLFPGTKQGWRPTPSCPKGHKLEEKTVAGSWFGSAKTCSKCSSQLTAGQTRYSSKASNYHLCASCYRARADEMLREEITITVYRAAQPGLLPGLGVEEDAFQVSIVAGATVDELKARIHELYGLPRIFQALRRDADSPPLVGGEPLACDADDVLYLGGAPSGGPLAGLFGGLGGGVSGATPLAGLTDMLTGALQEAAQMNQAWQESLQNTECKIRCTMPARGRTAERRCEMVVCAAARAAEVLEMAKLELNAEGEDLVLEFAGEPLPAAAPIHLLGLQDGDTVLVMPPKAVAGTV